MLGIIIGIASVTSVVALGAGGREKVLSDIRARSAPTRFDIYPGHGFSAMQKATGIQTLRAARCERARSKQPYVDAVTPLVSTNASVLGSATHQSQAQSMASGSSTSGAHPFEVLQGQHVLP